jgi:hypothetical protein
MFRRLTLLPSLGECIEDNSLGPLNEAAVNLLTRTIFIVEVSYKLQTSEINWRREDNLPSPKNCKCKPSWPQNIIITVVKMTAHKTYREMCGGRRPGASIRKICVIKFKKRTDSFSCLYVMSASETLWLAVLATVTIKMAVFWVVVSGLIALMMEAVQTSETLVNLYPSTWRYNPGDSNLPKFAFFFKADRLSTMPKIT